MRLLGLIGLQVQLAQIFMNAFVIRVDGERAIIVVERSVVIADHSVRISFIVQNVRAVRTLLQCGIEIGNRFGEFLLFDQAKRLRICFKSGIAVAHAEAGMARMLNAAAKMISLRMNFSTFGCPAAGQYRANQP